MPYKVMLSKTAQKVYDRQTSKLRLSIDRCISNLAISPKYGPNIRELKGYQACYRYQLGGWRILYEVSDSEMQVQVYQIRPRGDVYKRGH